MRPPQLWICIVIALTVESEHRSIRGAATQVSGAQPLDNPLETIRQKQVRSENEDDRLSALAHFSAGHILNEREQRPEALREYERALRYSPDALPALREMVPLADSLHRTDEAMRYLAKYVQQRPEDPLLLERSAEFLADSGDYQQALELYRHLVRLLSKETPSARLVSAQKELGKLCLLCDQGAEAAAAMKQVLAALEKPEQFGVDPVSLKALSDDDDALYELLGAVFLEANDAGDARRAFQDLDKLHPDAAMLAYNLARVEFAAGKPDAALTQLENYFSAKDPKASNKGTAPYELLAKILKKSNRQDQFVSRLERLHKEQPENALVAYELAEQYRQANQLDRAQELLAASEPPESNEPWVKALAGVYRQRNETEKLLNLLVQVLEKTNSLALLGDEAQAIAGDKSTVDRLADAAQKRSPPEDKENACLALRAVGLIAAEAKRWDDVKALFNQAIPLQPKNAGDLLLLWGLGLALDNQLAEAEQVFRRGLDEQRFPDDNSVVYAYLAGVLDLEGKTDAALVAAKTAVNKNPKNAKLRGRVPAILYHAKRYDEAAKAYQELIDEFQNNFSDDDARDTVREARLALSNMCVLNNQLKPAVEWLEQVLDEFPDDPGANNDLGYLWADNQQHLQRALAMIQLAVAAEPENNAFRDSLGWVLFRLGRYDDAVVELQKVTRGDHPEGEVLDHLGETYSKLGKGAEAKSTWMRAAEAFQKAGEPEKMKVVEKKTDSR